MGKGFIFSGEYKTTGGPGGGGVPNRITMPGQSSLPGEDAHKESVALARFAAPRGQGIHYLARGIAA